MTNNETTFTEEEFNQQVCEFRKLMGDKEFWKKPISSRDIAQQALIYSYFNLRHTLSVEEMERCATVLQSTLTEYAQRATMMESISEKPYDGFEGQWPGDGSGMDDLADYNQMEAMDYMDE